MTEDYFNEWFNWFFIPDLFKYLDSLGLPRKALVILDNAPVHGRYVNEDWPQVELMFLPPNVTSVCQPMDQCPIKSFKSHYLRILMQKVIESDDNGIDMKSFFNSFKIDQAMDLAAEAWNLVTPNTIINSFTKLIPPEKLPQKADQPVSSIDFTQSIPSITSALQTDPQFAALAKRVGFDHLDVEEFLAEPEEDLVDLETLSTEELTLLKSAGLPPLREPDSLLNAHSIQTGKVF